MTPLARLAAAHAATRVLVHAVPADAWTRPTPCDDWDVAGLVRHLVVGERIFDQLVRTGAADRAPLFAYAEGLGVEELAAAYDEGAAALRAAYELPGAMDGRYPLPIGELSAVEMVELRTIEELTHGWDLGRALDLALPADDTLAEPSLVAARALKERLPPERYVFADPAPVADEAPALDRLAALLGRPVTPG